MRKQILNHGYLELVEAWGSDERIVEAARMSTGKGFLGWGSFRCEDCGHAENKRDAFLVNPYNPDSLAYDQCPKCGKKHCRVEGKEGDEKLLAYLWSHKHATPFEMAGMIVEVKAPIMVYREWHRHRTQSYNEMSARYTPLPDENYIPTVERLMINSKTNKQAGTIKGAAELTDAAATRFRMELEDMYQQQERLYQSALQSGVPKELARIHLPVGRYSRMRASANLRNWLAFLTLRMAPEAQWEIRQYANAVGELVANAFPRTWELFVGGSK